MSALTDIYNKGCHDVVKMFNIKEAGWVNNLGRMAFGHPDQLLREGTKAFGPGGMLSAKNVFWPAVSGPGGSKLNWLARAGTAMLPLQLMGATKADPNEGKLTNLLGTVGGIAGNLYGFPAAGALGAPLVGRLGASVGKGIGRVLGSKPSQDIYSDQTGIQ